MMRSLILFAAILTALTACETYEAEEFVPQFLVESYLFGNEPLQPVYLSKTSELSTPYRFEDQAIGGATVRVVLKARPGTGEADQAFAYTMRSPGIYEPAAGVNHVVQPLRTYELDITGLNTPGIPVTRISGTTTIPDTLSILRIGYESQTSRPPYVPGTVFPVEYQQDDQLVVDLTLGRFTEGRDQHFYIFSIQAKDTARSNLTPFYAAVLEPDDIESVLINESGIINQKNYPAKADQSISVPLPWIAIAFFGENTIIMNSIDRNYYDFRRSQAVQLGGGTISPGEIHNPIYHLDGALGVFGSMSRTRFKMNVAKPAFLP